MRELEMKYNIERNYEPGKQELITTTTSERTAISTAKSEAAKGQGQIYITWYRETDGNKGYLNRDGHSPIGQAW